MTTDPPTWDTLEGHEPPRWFRDAALGIYFHWGPYSVPAFESEWYPRNMYREGSDASEHHREAWGPPEEFGYKDFIPMFDAEAFDPGAWADLCAAAGADFAGLTAIHHDGFALWDSEHTEWNAAEMGPERDVLGELAAALRERGIKVVAAFHHAHRWWYYPREEGYDTTDPEYAGLYGAPHEEGENPPEDYYADWRDKTIEVIDAYRPDLLWFDFGWGNAAFVEHDAYRREVVAHYYDAAEEWGKDVGIAHKKNLPVGVGIVDHERSRREDLARSPWLTDTSIDRRSWGYISDPDYKSVDTLVTGLVDRASKYGRTLLNVGPRPDGTIPEPAAERLRAVGDWLDGDGGAIRDTRPWWTFGEGPTEVTSTEFEEASSIAFTSEDVRFTRSADGATGYAVLMGWPPDGEATIETDPGQRLSAGVGDWAEGDAGYEVTLVATGEPVAHERAADGLHVTLPDAPPGEHAYALRIVPR